MIYIIPAISLLDRGIAAKLTGHWNRSLADDDVGEWHEPSFDLSTRLSRGMSSSCQESASTISTGSHLAAIRSSRLRGDGDGERKSCHWRTRWPGEGLSCQTCQPVARVASDYYCERGRRRPERADFGAAPRQSLWIPHHHKSLQSCPRLTQQGYVFLYLHFPAAAAKSTGRVSNDAAQPVRLTCPIPQAARVMPCRRPLVDVLLSH